MKLSRLTNKGLATFQAFIRLSREGNPPSPRDRNTVLQGNNLSEVVDQSISVGQAQFKTRFEAGEHLNQLLAGAKSQHLRDKGVWAWLTLCYFDIVCPPSSKAGEQARYIPEINSWTYYRHLLYGPFTIYRAHQDDPKRAMVALCGPVDTPGEVAEQIVSRQVFSIANVMEAATELYIAKDKLKGGASGKDAGSARRFARIVRQYDATYDLYTLSSQQLINLLPKAEFKKFKP